MTLLDRAQTQVIEFRPLDFISFSHFSPSRTIKITTGAVKPKQCCQSINLREQRLHWILVKFHKATTTLLKQGIAHKQLAHLDQTKSDSFLFSDLKILFVCLRMRCVRVLRFHHPLLEEGLEDAAEMASFHNINPIAFYALQILVLRPIAVKLIPLIKLESFSEPTNNNDEVENEEKEEEYQSEAPDENKEYNMNTGVSSSGLVYGVVDEQYAEGEDGNEGFAASAFSIVAEQYWDQIGFDYILGNLFLGYSETLSSQTNQISNLCWKSLADHCLDESFTTSGLAREFFSYTLDPTLTFFATAIANSPENELPEPYQHILSHVVTVSETFSVRMPSPTLDLSILLPFFLATDLQSFHIVAELLFHRKFQLSPSDLSETAVRYRIQHSSPILSDTVLNALTAKVVALEEIVVQMSDGHILGYADPVAEMFHKPRIVKKALFCIQNLTQDSPNPTGSHLPAVLPKISSFVKTIFTHFQTTLPTHRDPVMLEMVGSFVSSCLSPTEHSPTRVDTFLTLFGEDGDAVDTFKDVVGWLLSIPHPPLTDTAIKLLSSCVPTREDLVLGIMSGEFLRNAVEQTVLNQRLPLSLANAETVTIFFVKILDSFLHSYAFQNGGTFEEQRRRPAEAINASLLSLQPYFDFVFSPSCLETLSRTILHNLSQYLLDISNFHSSSLVVMKKIGFWIHLMNYTVTLSMTVNHFPWTLQYTRFRFFKPEELKLLKQGWKDCCEESVQDVYEWQIHLVPNQKWRYLNW
ncbi:hypothetical protein BLNAU_9761 [Blattamonas nauphoetae]|uniref:Uncharacterized protein n=1 Tax=Blattamonas nauphoetae TaxID=2049346 RepID=A0ABQ9XUQ6_9EUKA|nr:hypothetical protein BLNAU_9761 [Blattamonas nauphoetae]